jgi:putative transposase
MDWARGLGELPVPPNTAAKTRLAEQMDVSLRTVERRLERFHNDPTLVAQLDARPGPVPGTPRLNPQQEEMVEAAIDSIHLTRQRGSCAEATKEARRLCAAVGLPGPSYKAVRARIRAKSHLSRSMRRHGAQAAREQFAPAVGQLRPTGALSDVQIDHAVCDVMVVSEHDRRSIGRPHITAAIDVYTRCVLGYYLALEVPNQTAVALCLEHAAFPKREWLQSLGVSVDYPMFGMPERVRWDNARTFKARTVQMHCER